MHRYDGGAPPSVEDHFLALLATGTVDDAMEQFLSHEFQQGAVRRMAKSMDAAASAAHAVGRCKLNSVDP